MIYQLLVQEASRPGADRRPPRHARPRGWTGPTMPAPSPIVTGLPPKRAQAFRVALAQLQPAPHLNRNPLSHVSRESMRRRFRVMWWQHQSRPVV